MNDWFNLFIKWYKIDSNKNKPLQFFHLQGFSIKRCCRNRTRIGEWGVENLWQI